MKALISKEEKFFSIIIPVYNRPDEVKELLESLAKQTVLNFEVIIVEDGSREKCDHIVRAYANRIDIHYYLKENTGRSETRNYGMEKANYNYFVFFDSDCIIPEQYFEILTMKLNEKYLDVYGGPDRAHESFNYIQKAINYSMTSWITTGGIRGGKENMDKFHPRSFNMGFSRKVYEKVGGFLNMFGEDVDLSIRIMKAGFSSGLISEAFVYHKRRVNMKKYLKQVYTFGMARIILQKKHPGTLKMVHTLPSAFLIGSIALIFLCILISPWFAIPFGLFVLLIFFDALLHKYSVKISIISIYTSFLQLIGYGYGFIRALFLMLILNKENDEEFLKKFYK